MVLILQSCASDGSSLRMRHLSVRKSSAAGRLLRMRTHSTRKVLPLAYQIERTMTGMAARGLATSLNRPNATSDWFSHSFDLIDSGRHKKPRWPVHFEKFGSKLGHFHISRPVSVFNHLTMP